MVKKIYSRTAKTFHKFSWSRIYCLWFWKGQIICRLFGHRINDDHKDLSCGRCGLAYEEIYNGLEYYGDMRERFR